MLPIGSVDGKRHAIGGGIDDGHNEGGGRRDGVHEGEGLGALKVGGKCLGSLDFPCKEGLTEGKGRGRRKDKVLAAKKGIPLFLPIPLTPSSPATLLPPSLHSYRCSREKLSHL